MGQILPPCREDLKEEEEEKENKNRTKKSDRKPRIRYKNKQSWELDDETGLLKSDRGKIKDPGPINKHKNRKEKKEKVGELFISRNIQVLFSVPPK